MSNSKLEAASRKFKSAAADATNELSKHYPVGSLVKVRLSSTQIDWSEAKVFGWGIYHGSLCVIVELLHAKKWSRNKRRYIPYYDTVLIDKTP